MISSILLYPFILPPPLRGLPLPPSLTTSLLNNHTDTKFFKKAKDIPPFDRDEYKKMFRQDVIAAFSQRPEWRITDKEKCPLNLPLYFQENRDATWKGLYRTFATMERLWQSRCDYQVILAGLPLTGKSTILRFLQSIHMGACETHLRKKLSYGGCHLYKEEGPEVPLVISSSPLPLTSTPTTV